MRPYEDLRKTAAGPAFLRMNAGIAYADQIAQRIGAQQALAEMVGGLHHLQTMKRVMGEYMCLRFNAMSAAARGTRRKNVFEIACGFSPRGLIASEDKSITYIGVDLKDSVEEMAKLVFEVLGSNNRDNLMYRPADVFNREELMRRSINFRPFGNNAKSRTVVISEGLLAYYTHEEQANIATNIRELLRAVNGVWLTDVLIADQWERISRLTDSYIENFSASAGRSYHPFKSEEHARTFFQELGFDVIAVPAREYMPGRPDFVSTDPPVLSCLRNELIWTLRPR